jgi:hypothetical protein
VQWAVGHACSGGGTRRDIGTRAVFVSQQMTLSALYILLLASVACSALHAHEEAPKQRPSAVSWLKIDDLSATRDRPLFAPDRRKSEQPSTPPVAVSVDHGPPRPQFALMGIIIEPSATIVLLRDLARAESVTVRSGEKFGRWRLVVETDRTVKLRDGGEELELAIFAEP